MEVKKRILRADRLRRLPQNGWSWIDRRFVREKAPDLDRDSILLYFFLASAADQHGLSFWSDAAIAGRLRLSDTSLDRARAELERHDLIAYQKPLYQVLSIAECFSLPHRKDGEPVLLEDFFRKLAGERPSNHCPPGNGERA